MRYLGQRTEARGDPERHEKRCAGEGERNGADNGLRKATSEEPVDRRADERQQRDQPEMEILVHSSCQGVLTGRVHFSRFHPALKRWASSLVVPTAPLTTS